MIFKGNQQVFSDLKDERVKGFRKLFKKQEDSYKPNRDIAESLIEAMEAQGYDITLKEAMAYLKASIAVHTRDYHVQHRKS